MIEKGKPWSNTRRVSPGSRRPGMREGQHAGSCLFDGGGEASPKPRLLLVVVDDLGKELTARAGTNRADLTETGAVLCQRR